MKGMEEADVEAGSENLFSRLIGKIKELFGIHSPSTVMAEIGGFIVEGMLNGILDSLKSIGSWVKEHIFEPFIRGFKNAFGIHSPSTVMAEMGGYIIQGLLNGLKNMWGSITSWIEDKVSWIIEKFQSVKDKVSGFFSGGGSGDSGKNYYSHSYSMRSMSMPYSMHPAIEKLNNMPIPGYATGQVIPRTMQKHLAWLGDNNRETEVVSPLSTIEQAVINAMAKMNDGANNSGGNTYNVKAIANTGVIFEMMIEEGKARLMSTGINPFDLGTI